MGAQRINSVAANDRAAILLKWIEQGII